MNKYNNNNNDIQKYNTGPDLGAITSSSRAKRGDPWFKFLDCHVTQFLAMTSSLIAILFLITSISVEANNKLNLCKPTKEHRSNFEPENFPSSNNLLRKPGQYPVFCGTKMFIRGKLVDKNCVPIQDAKVYIWQVACDGKYPYTPLRHVYDKNKDINIGSGATFTGSGTATTDNKGEFYFITAYPGSFKGLKPHIDVRIKHHSFPDFDTRLHVSKESAPDDSIEHEISYDTEADTLINEFVIVLPYKQVLKEF